MQATVQTTVQTIAEQHRALPGGLMPALHAVQAALGHVPDAAVPVLAEAFALSRAEVHGVISFYPDFRRAPAGRHVLRLCRAEACLAHGGDALRAHAESRLGCKLGETRPDGAVTLEAVYCLGLCASTPALILDGEVHARVGAQRLDELLAQAGVALDAVNAVAAPASTPGGSSEVEDDAEDHAVQSSAAGPAARAGHRSDGMAPQTAVRVFVPRDAAARAVGADAVAAALQAEAAQRGLAIDVVRTGSRGLAWLEPLVEVHTPAGRVAYGRVAAHEVAGLLDAGLLQGAAHERSLGLIETLPWLARQRRLATARIGLVDPRSFEDFRAHGGGAGLERALDMAPADIVQAVFDAGLRGRGGAAFPAGIKWRTVLGAAGPRKHVVCNADEGDSGSFADRLLMEGDPFSLLEGMAIAALAVGALEGWIYVRSEYPDAVEALRAAIEGALAAGWLGDRLADRGPPFHVHLRVGAGSYVCGEETALLESLEGRRGIVRAKPPLPAHQGLFGEPTVMNNVVTLASVPAILADGAAAYAALGHGRSRGTMPFQLAGNLRHGGLVELPFGCTLRELIFEFGGGTASGRPVKAVQVGGPLGRYVPEPHWDLPIDYEAWAAVGAVVGHGSLVVHDDSADMARLARHAMAFCVHESCGKCTPCRIGAQRGVETIDRLLAAPDAPSRQRLQGLLVELCGTMQHGSLCAMGGMTPYPVLSALEQHPADFGLPPSPHSPPSPAERSA